MSLSIWMNQNLMPGFPKLQGSHKTDVLVIGGGLCGVLCTYFLKNAGVDCMLVEAKTIGSGISGNTTAKITSQHGLIYGKLYQSYGREAAAAYLQANERALEQYRAFAGTIDCDFEERDSFVYTLKDRSMVERETEIVNRLGYPAEFCEQIPLPVPAVGAIRFPKQAQFHPLKFLAAVARELPIYEHTFIRDLSAHRAWFDGGEISADKIIVTTHFPFLNKHGSYFLKLYQHRSYVLALEGTPTLPGMYVDEAQNGFSFRNYKGLLLLGGGGHRTGKKGGGFQQLRTFAGLHYPQARETAAWATQDCMSLDKVPYIGQYSKRTEDLYVASGFQKWGMTTSMAAAMLLRDLVLEKDNEFAQVFSPGRNMFKPQLFVNGAEALMNLLTFSRKRCPHLGCALKWNPQEHTWDCPCHGSRFEEDGSLIDNPATGDAKV